MVLVFELTIRHGQGGHRRTLFLELGYPRNPFSLPNEEGRGRHLPLLGPRAKPPGCKGYVAVIIPAEDEPREPNAASTILLAAALLPLGMATNRFVALFADKHREQDRHHDAIRAGAR